MENGQGEEEANGLSNGLGKGSVNGTAKLTNGHPVPSSAAALEAAGRKMLLECHDGSTWLGHSFGADRSVAGELVFQVSSN